MVLIVPRHPQRFEEVAKLIEKSGFTYIKRSEIRDWKTVLSKQGPQIVLGDSMGEMGFTTRFPLSSSWAAVLKITAAKA